jgi:hypothetical protein
MWQIKHANIYINCSAFLMAQSKEHLTFSLVHRCHINNRTDPLHLFVGMGVGAGVGVGVGGHLLQAFFLTSQQGPEIKKGEASQFCPLPQALQSLSTKDALHPQDSRATTAQALPQFA